MELREVPKFILCPCCNEKYNDVERRRIIDSCGHPRCFTCLCKSSACPHCSKSKQITDIGVPSPGGESNDYVRWKPRSVSMSANIQTGMLQKNQRSKSLCQLDTRTASQKGYPLRNSTDSNPCGTTDTIASNSVSDITDIRNRKEGIKIDRKMSFSSVLNRNSESYKQSRFRRASSFSFMPRENTVRVNGDVLPFESNLKIRHRPRPRSLNLSLEENSERDSSHASIQSNHGCEEKKESNRRKRLDSIVEMASAWLEESKSVMQNQCFVTASEKFHFIEEEKAQAEINDSSAKADNEPKSNLGKQNERGDLNGGTFKCQFTNEKDIPVDRMDDSDSSSNSESETLSEAENEDTEHCVVACARESDGCGVSNLEVSPVSKDSHDSVSSDLTTATDDECYLRDVRALLKMLRKGKKEEKNENSHVINTDCVMKNVAPQQGFIGYEDEIDATVSGQSQRRCETYGSSLQDLETKSGIDTGGKRAPRQLQCNEYPIDTVEGRENSSDYPIKANETSVQCDEEKLSLVKDISAIDNERNEQEENHFRANCTAKFTGWDNPSKQTEAQTSADVQQSVPVGVVGLNSFSFSAINVLNDQISSNDPQIIKEKTLDILPRALVKRSARPRSFSSMVDIKSKMTEIQYLPSLKKNRSKRSSSFGSLKHGWKSPTTVKENDFDARVASSSSDRGLEALAVMSLPQSNQAKCSKTTASRQCRKSSDEPHSLESLEDRECSSALQLTDMGDNTGDSEPAVEQSNKNSNSSVVGEHSGDINVGYLDESIDPFVSEKLNPLGKPVAASTFSCGTEECSAQSENNLTTASESCLEVGDNVEEIFVNKTDDWKSVNMHMIQGKENIDVNRHNEIVDGLTVQDKEVPVVFVNGEDFCPSWHNDEKVKRKMMHQERNRGRKGRSRGDDNTSLRNSQTPGIGFLREKFQKLARWSKRGNEIESGKGRRKYAFGKKYQHKQKGKKNLTSHDTIGSSGAKNISFYDVNRNVVMSSSVVRNMRESRKVRRRKLDKEEGCSLNRKQMPKAEKQFQDGEKLVRVMKRLRPTYNGDRKALLKSNQTDDISLTTVSTLADNFNHYNDSDSSSFSAHDSGEEGDSSDSTLNHHLLHSNYSSSSSDTINESIEESEMPDFRTPSRIQEDLAALLERKVTRKRQGLEEIDFHPLIPATKGKALVPRDWLYERFHLLLDRRVKDAKNVLLISGRNGCGKTTLLKSLIWSDCIGHGKKRMREKISKSILSFHFCSNADANTTSSAKFVLNMAACLVENSQFAAYTRSLFDSNFLRKSLSRKTAEKSPEIALRDGILKPLNEIYGSGCSRNYLLLLDSLDHECNQCRPEECITSLLASNVHLLPSWITLVIAGTKDSLQLFDRQEADEISLENIANWDIQSDLYSFTEMELPILSSQLSQSKIQKLVDNIVRFCRGSFHVAHMSVQYLSSSFASFIHQPNLHSLDVDKLVGHLFNMKFCITERSKILALSLLEILLVSQELLTLSNLFKAIESSCTSQSVSFQEYESCLRKLLQLEMIAESTEGRYFLNNISRHWMQSSDGLKTGLSPSKGHNLLSVYYMKTLTNNDGKNIYLLAYHLSQSSFGEDIKDNEKRVSFLAWTLNQVFKDTTGGFIESCNVYRPIVDVYHLFLHTELDMKAFEREYGAHPIVIASSLKQTHLVSLIVQHKMYEGTHLYQALEEATRVGSSDIFDILIGHVSGVSLLKPRDQGTQKSCLDIALEGDQLLTAVKLLASIWKTENEDDPGKAVAAQRVLCKACLHGRIDIVEKLLSGGYICDIDELDNEGNAPLVLAASGNHLVVAKCLVENHGNVDVIDGNGLTPLLSSVMNGNTETSEWLISQDANVNAEDKTGRTPLIYAAMKDLPQLVHSLFMEGSTLNHQDHSGLTALSHACKNGCSEVAKTLLNNRAVTEMEDWHKRTPLHYACLNRNLHSIQVLLDHGANVNHKNGKGQKPLEIALKEGYLDVAALLLRYGANVGKPAVNIAESSLGAFLCLVGHLEQRGNIMIKAGKYVAANEDFQRALNIIDNSAHRNNKRVIRIKLLCQQDSRQKFI